MKKAVLGIFVIMSIVILFSSCEPPRQGHSSHRKEKERIEKPKSKRW